MPVNELDQTRGQQYVNTYVPLPLDQLNSLAKDYSDRYNASKAMVNEIDHLSESIKAAPIHENMKASYIGDYNKQMNNLVDSARPEDWAKPEFQQKANRIIRQFKTDPRLGKLQNTYNFWDKEGQKYINSDDYSRNINIQQWKNPDGTWKQTDNDVQSIDHVKYQNHVPDVKSIMDGISVSGESINNIQKDGKGYFVISNGHRKGINDADVDAVAGANVANYANTPGGNFRFAELLSKVGADPRTSYTEFMLDESIPKEAKIEVDKYLKNDLKSYGIKQVHSDVDINKSMKNDVIGLKDMMQGTPGLPQTAPNMSDIDNITQDLDPSIKDAFSTDSEGNVKININNLKPSKTKVIGKTPGLTGSPLVIADFFGALGERKVSDAQDVALYNATKNAAESIGWTGKITAGKTIKDPKTGEILKMGYEDIFTEYNTYSKNISPQEILEGADRNMTTEDLIKDRENYTFKDADGKVIPDDEMPFLSPKNFAATARTTKGHKVEIKANYTGEDGKVKRFIIEPHGSQSNSYYSTTGKLKEDTQTFFRTGSVGANAKKDISVFKEALKNTNTLFSNDGREPISFQPVPGSPGQYMVASASKTNRKDVKMTKVQLGLDANKKVVVVGQIDINGGLDGAVQAISKDWFTKTPEGQRKASSLLGGNKQYEYLIGQED